MALEIRQPKQSAVGLVADRRLYLTRDGARVVEDGSSEAATLFATPETLISQDEVDRLGLSLVDGRIALPGAEPVAAPDGEQTELDEREELEEVEPEEEPGEDETPASSPPAEKPKARQKTKRKGASG